MDQCPVVVLEDFDLFAKSEDCLHLLADIASLLLMLSTLGLGLDCVVQRLYFERPLEGFLYSWWEDENVSRRWLRSPL